METCFYFLLTGIIFKRASLTPAQVLRRQFQQGYKLVSLEGWLTQNQAWKRPPEEPVGTKGPWVPRSSDQGKKKSILLTKGCCLLFVVVLPLVFSIKETAAIFAMSRATALLSWGTGNSLRCKHVQDEGNYTISRVLESPFHRHKNRG